eukprot:Protomagalhaensia_sp_Gyna_25__6037@NODE_954_length_2358_cov_31_444157_g758_i0_p1_GENE_NODE_954_length_2358_cov_31_444157_g758_i0NODE_954_length_2358_cov_31_444157_g758_i0_p1_ORF_typecomplete_len555_score39_38zftrcl/PF13451_6/0_11_NODE_954_length_2358_cov_31_444157_g758_i04952159
MRLVAPRMPPGPPDLRETSGASQSCRLGYTAASRRCSQLRIDKNSNTQSQRTYHESATDLDWNHQKTGSEPSTARSSTAASPKRGARGSLKSSSRNAALPLRRKRVRWATSVESAESKQLYRERVRRRVLTASPSSCFQCRQNIHKVLHDAAIFCPNPTNQIRAALTLRPRQWTDRPDYVPVVPFQRTLDLCQVELAQYPLFAHFALNFWLRYDASIETAPLLLICPAVLTYSTSTFSEGPSDLEESSPARSRFPVQRSRRMFARPVRVPLSSDSEGGSPSVVDPPRVPRLSIPLPTSRLESSGSSADKSGSFCSSLRNNGNVWIPSPSGSQLLSRRAVLSLRRPPMPRPLAWIHNTVSKTQALFSSLLRRPAQQHFWPGDAADPLEELIHPSVSNTESLYEIRYLDLSDITVKLHILKEENHTHGPLKRVCDTLIQFFDQRIREIHRNSTKAFEFHLRLGLSINDDDDRHSEVSSRASVNEFCSAVPSSSPRGVFTDDPKEKKPPNTPSTAGSLVTEETSTLDAGSESELEDFGIPSVPMLPRCPLLTHPVSP